MKRTFTFLFLLLVIGLNACKKDNPLPVTLTEKLAYKWTWTQFDEQDIPDTGSPGIPQSYNILLGSYTEFKANGQVDLFDGTEHSYLFWAKLDEQSFLISSTPVCKIIKIDDNELVFYFETPYDGGKVKQTFGFTR